MGHRLAGRPLGGKEEEMHMWVHLRHDRVGDCPSISICPELPINRDCAHH